MKDECTVVRAHLKGLHPVTIRIVKVCIRYLCCLTPVLNEILVDLCAHFWSDNAFCVREIDQLPKWAVVEFPYCLVLSHFDHIVPNGRAWLISGELCQLISPYVVAEVGDRLNGA
jgi:hypothetical protein